MLSGALRTAIGSERGAVGATYAIALLPLVLIGGVAFDYGRLVALDSELQNGADQAALAGATQLDGKAAAGSVPDACARAAAAASSLLANLTVLANDGAGNALVIPNEPTCDATGSIKFWQNSAGTTAATTPANARFIEVTVNARTARYALTPVVGAFGGRVEGSAMAGLGSSLCRSPPVMICNPGETAGNVNTSVDFDIAANKGRGVRLVTVGAGGGWVPGNFGYLDSNAGSNGAPGLREALGWTSVPGDCIAQSGVDTKPGANVSVTDALNTRFDIYDGNVSCPTGGTCPSSINSVKDVQRAANANGTNSCRLHNQGWELPPSGSGNGQRYLPTSATVPLATTITPAAMGHPRDMCHAVASSTAGYCTSPVGNGLWDRDAYFRTHYRRSDNTRWTSSEWQANTGLGATATRYDVYKWEIANRGTTVDGVVVLGPSPAGANGSTKVNYGSPVCSASEGHGTGVVPGTNSPDRRKFPVAIVNCIAAGVNGNSTNVPVRRWMDVFLVEPSINRDRTGAGDIYIEIVGETQVAGDGIVASQTIRRDVPYLVK